MKERNLRFELFQMLRAQSSKGRAHFCRGWINLCPGLSTPTLRDISVTVTPATSRPLKISGRPSNLGSKISIQQPRGLWHYKGNSKTNNHL